MTLEEGIKLKGKKVEIPDCSRDDLPQFFKNLGFKVGVEVGVYKAAFMEKLCQAGLFVYGVDPWRIYDDYNIKYGSRSPVAQDRQDFLFGHAQRVLKDYDCVLIRKTSMEAVNDFEDGSIDFVYIDGHHGFKYVTEDIWEWSKKVRKGGIISGHDYGNLNREARHPYTLHVGYVIDAYTEAIGIKNWYVLGSKEKVEGEKRDDWRSWMWFNE